jgi:hypothetical protein
MVVFSGNSIFFELSADWLVFIPKECCFRVKIAQKHINAREKPLTATRLTLKALDTINEK